MKRTGLLLLLITSTSFFSYSQNTWTWLKGTKQTPKYGVYGQQGIADIANVPGFRTGETSWVDAAGDIWMFGGMGNARNTLGTLNDLWKFSKATNTWTWISGSEGANSFGNYGKKGVSSPNNQIRSRAYAATWIDKAGNFWVYGGQGYDNFTVNPPPIMLNDFWKFEPATLRWTWMGGDTTSKFKVGYASVPGTKGGASATTYPGSRYQATSWMDNDGDRLWLMGGREPGPTNALWSYSISSGLWTWVSGDPTGSNTGSFGTKGTAAANNQPPPRWGATSWKDNNGDLFLFAGQRSGSAPVLLNDVWKYSVASGLWTWVAGADPFLGSTAGNYGTLGIPSAENSPAGRVSAIQWTDQSGNIWVYGGSGSTGLFNDVWKFLPGQNQWAWMQGPQGGATLSADYGVKGSFSTTNRPASATNFSAWTDSNNQFFLRSSNQNWQFNSALLQWAWLGGDTTAAIDLVVNAKSVYGTPGTFAIGNQPNFRKRAQTWTDSTGNLWLFGGASAPFNNLNHFDFWKYSTLLNQWAWMGGDSLVNKPAVYGELGIPSASSFPGGSSGGYTWTDKSGNLWMFSGSGNELWKYNVSTGMWTWIGGNATASNVNYGTRGVPSPSNYPPARVYGGVNWVDKAGENVWFFGGGGLSRGGNLYDDQVWRYNMPTNIWTFFSGATNPLAAGVNRRTGMAAWVDNNGEFWSFGGSDFISVDGERNNYNDLRKFNPVTGTFTLIKGDVSARKRGVYGVKGVPSPDNTPGARIFARSWADDKGNLYLFGGTYDSLNFTSASLPGYFNDTWRYNIASNQWTWITGDSTLDHWGIYGTQGIASVQTKPGGREESEVWSDGKGGAWLFSGYGFADNGLRTLDDMMRFSPFADAALPVRFGSFTAVKKEQSIILNWSTVQEFNAASYVVERSGDGIQFDAIGRVAAHGNSASTVAYSFTDLTPLPGINIYRLKEVDLDNRFMYSELKQVNFDASKSLFGIMGNPVGNSLSLNVDMQLSTRAIIRISNATGQTLIEKEYKIQRGNSIIGLDVSTLSKGVYTVSIFSDGIRESRNFLKR